MTERDDRFIDFIDNFLVSGSNLGDLLSSDIVELSLLLDAELQSRAGLDINDQNGELNNSWAEYDATLYEDLLGE